MKPIFTIAIITSAIFSFAQTKKIDSLKTLVYRAAPGTGKLDALLALCGENQSMNIDTLFYYATQAKLLAQSAEDKSKRILADEAMIAWLERRNLFDSALALCNANLAQLQYTKPWDVYARLTIKKDVIFVKTNQRKDALALAFRFLGEAEAKEDIESQVYCKYIIANVYRYMEQTELALQWALKAGSTGSDSLYQETEKRNRGVFSLPA